MLGKFKFRRINIVQIYFISLNFFYMYKKIHKFSRIVAEGDKGDEECKWFFLGNTGILDTRIEY